MIKTVICTVIFILLASLMQAQDPVFSQYFLVPQTLNPGFTGYNETTNVGVIHRTQWSDLQFKIETNYGYINTYLPKVNSGFGVNVINQRQSTTEYNFFQVNFNYVYQVQLSDTWYFRPGLEVGYGQRNFGLQGLVLADQINIDTGTINQNSIDARFLNERIRYWDISAGLIFNTNNAWIGVSAKHLNRPNITLANNDDENLEVFYSISAGYEFPLSDFIDIQFLPFETKLFVTGNYMRQGNFNRLDIGSTLIIDRFFIGATAVTNPNKNNTNNDLLTSINAIVGLQYSNFRFGLSYDFNTSQKGRTGGIYELSLTYRFKSVAEKCYGCPNYK